MEALDEKEQAWLAKAIIKEGMRQNVIVMPERLLSKLDLIQFVEKMLDMLSPRLEITGGVSR